MTLLNIQAWLKAGLLVSAQQLSCRHCAAPAHAQWQKDDQPFKHCLAKGYTFVPFRTQRGNDLYTESDAIANGAVMGVTAMPDKVGTACHSAPQCVAFDSLFNYKHQVLSTKELQVGTRMCICLQMPMRMMLGGRVGHS